MNQKLNSHGSCCTPESLPRFGDGGTFKHAGVGALRAWGLCFSMSLIIAQIE